METIAIILIIIVVFSCVIIAKGKKNEKEKQRPNRDIIEKNISVDTEENTIVLTINSKKIIEDFENLSDNEKEKLKLSWKKKSIQYELKEKRQIRHKHIYEISDVLTLLVELKYSKDFYEFERCLNSIKSKINKEFYLFAETKEYCEYTQKAIRLYQMRFHSGLSPFNLDDDVCYKLIHPKEIDIEKMSYDIAYIVLKEFKEYWTNVLLSYKRKDAYKKRLNYLINYIDELKTKKYICQFPDIILELNNIKDDYRQKLEQAI